MTGIVNLAMVDDERARAIGALCVRHAQLDRMLRMTIKSITQADLGAVLQELVGDGSAKLRGKITKAAKKTLGGFALVALVDVLDRCEQVTKQRNQIIHGFIAIPDGGDALCLITEDDRALPVPTAQAVTALAQEVYGLAKELNFARRNGFLQEAMNPTDHRR